MNTQFYLHVSKKTIPGGQRWFINKLRTLIKSKSHREEFNEGLCFGISLMWIQALLANDLATFNRRLSILAKFNSAEEMQGAIERVKRKKLKGETISKDDEITFTLPIFLDGLLIHACLGEFAHLFPEGKRTSSQNGELSFAFTAPVNIQGGIELIRAPNTSSNASFIGTYTKAELIRYFDSLTKLLQSPPVSYSIGVELGTTDHSISVGFNHQLQKWMFTDANELPPKPVNSSQELVKLILEAETFATHKKMISFGSSFYVAGENKSDFEGRMQQWTKGEDWQQIHAATPKKVKHYNKDENTSWILTAILLRDEQLVLQLLTVAEQNGFLAEIIEQEVLQKAAKNGLVNVIKYLLDKGAPRNKPNANGFTALHSAALGGQLEVAKTLLTHGDDIEVDELIETKSGVSETALHLAAAQGDVDFVQLLLQHGAEIDVCDETETTPFHAAASAGHVGVLRLLYRKDPSQLEKPDSLDETPLFAAVEAGRLDAVKYLLSKHAKVNAKNISDETPLHRAAENGHSAVLECLVSKIKKSKRLKAINAANDDGNTPLHLAAMHGSLDVVKTLLKMGAKSDIKNDKGETPLEIAVKNDKRKVVKILLGVAADKYAVNKNGDTLLHLAAKHNRLRMMQFLKVLGFKTDVRNLRDEPQLQAAVTNGHLDAVDYLIKNGDDAGVVNQRNETLLHLAAKSGRVKVVEYLAQGGAKLDAKDKHGRTPIELAIKCKHKKTAHYLADYQKQQSDQVKEVQQQVLNLEAGEDDLAIGIQPSVSEPAMVEPNALAFSQPSMTLSEKTVDRLQALILDLSKSLAYEKNGAFGAAYKFFSNLHETRGPKLYAMSAITNLIADDNKEELENLIRQMLKEDGSYVYRDGTKKFVLRTSDVMYTTWPLHSRSAELIHQIAKELHIRSDQKLKTSFKS